MKLSILTSELREAIQNVAKAIPTKPTVTTNTTNVIKVEVTFEGITLTASDINITIESFIALENDNQVIAQIERPGSVLLPAKFFIEIVKKLPSQTIEIEGNEQFQLSLRAGETDIQIIGLDPEQYPASPNIEEKQMVTINSFLLKTIIKQTIFAASVNETTPILTGVLWSLDKKSLKCIATDRHRLASRTIELETSFEIDHVNIVISGRTLNELNKIIHDQNLQINIIVSDNQILFKIGRVFFYAQVLDGSYPDTSKIIPQNYKTELILNTKKLIEAIDRAYLLSREDKTNIVRLQTKEDGGIEISSSSSELGCVTEQLDVKQFQGESLRISFNSKYMLDVLKIIESEHIFIGFTGAMSPIIIQPMESINSLYLILPYRTMN